MAVVADVAAARRVPLGPLAMPSCSSAISWKGALWLTASTCSHNQGARQRRRAKGEGQREEEGQGEGQGEVQRHQNVRARSLHTAQ